MVSQCMTVKRWNTFNCQTSDRNPYLTNVILRIERHLLKLLVFHLSRWICLIPLFWQFVRLGKFCCYCLSQGRCQYKIIVRHTCPYLNWFCSSTRTEMMFDLNFSYILCAFYVIVLIFERSFFTIFENYSLILPDEMFNKLNITLSKCNTFERRRCCILHFALISIIQVNKTESAIFSN
jgi:hypothetical protein